MIHERIAEVLGWTVAETKTLSLASLRELVRPLDPKLAEEIGQGIDQGRHLTR